MEDLVSDIKRGLSRRQFLGTAAAAAAVAGSRPGAVLSAQTPRTTDASGRTRPDQTLVLTNGRIHTMDAGNSVVNTVSIRNGRFVAVGGRPPAPGSNTTLIDLKGRTGGTGLLQPHHP